MHPILLPLSISGFLISLYFTLVSRGILTHSSRLVGTLCSKSTCTRVIDTPYARLFRIPNFELGMLYYGIVFASAFVALGTAQQYLLLGIAWFTAAISIYLAYALVIKLRTNCTLCFAAQAINLLIAVTYTIHVL